MRKTSRFISALLAVLMIFSLLPLSALAEETTVARIGEAEYSSLSDAIAAASEGQTVEIVKEGTYKLPNIPKNITVKADVEGVEIDANGSGSICSIPNGVSFEGLTFNFGSSSYHGFQHAGTINMEKCTLNGLLFSYGDMNFEECTFNAPGSEYCMWAYGKDLTYTNCTFNGAGKFLNVYCENNSNAYNITAKGCSFNSTKTNKAAFNVKETSGSNVLHYNVVIEDCTTNENFPAAGENGKLKVISPLVQVDDRILEGTENGGEITVSVDNKELYETQGNYVAKIGDNKYSSLDNAIADAKSGDTVEIVKSGTYTLPNIPLNITIDGKDNEVVFNCEGKGSICSIPNGATFKNVTFNMGQQSYHGFQHAGKLNFEKCTFNGLFFSYGEMNFTNCDFKQTASEYMMWAYGMDVVYDGCTFTNEATGKFINVYNEGGEHYSVTVKDCKFINNSGSAKKAALNIKETCGSKLLSFDVIVDNCTTEGAFPEATEDNGGTLFVLNSLVQVDDRNADSIEAEKVVVKSADKQVYPDKVCVAKIGDTEYSDLNKALRDAVKAGTDVSVEIIADVDLTGKTWTPITVTNCGVITVEGNDHTITGLSDMLFDKAWAGKAGLVINDLTIADSNIVNDENDENGTVGVGAFVGYPEAIDTVTLNNCHLVDSTVSGGHWTGGLVGACAGWDKASDGPVFTTLTIKDCSVENSTIVGKGSVGGFIGHATQNAATKVIIEDCTADGNSVTGEKVAKTGKLIGTIGAAGTAEAFNGEVGGVYLNATERGTTTELSGDINIVGRIGSTGGAMTATGGSYTSDPTVTSDNSKGTLAPAEGYEIIVSKDIYYVRAICNHEKTELKNAKDATCTEEGYTGDEVCSACNETITKGTAIKALGHSYVDGVCTRCGYVVIDAPTALKVSNDSASGSPKLEWTGVDGAVKYYVYRSNDKHSGYKYLGTAKTTSYIDDSADVGSKYFYRVRAVNADKMRSYPSNIVGRTCDCAQPVVTASNIASTGLTKLTWSTIEGAEKYYVYRAASKDGDYSKIGSTTSTSYTDKTAKAGEKYYYKVKAICENTAANSAKSSAVARTCNCAQPVVTASNTASTGLVKLTWSAIEGADKYCIYRATSKSGDYTEIGSTTKTSYTDKTAKAGEKYYYKVKVVCENSHKNSAKSSAVARTCDCARPDVSIKLSSGHPKLNWTAIDSADQYNVYRATSKGGDYSKIGSTTSTSYTDKTAKSGKTYFYKVKAINANSAANSAYSSVDSIAVK